MNLIKSTTLTLVLASTSAIAGTMGPAEAVENYDGIYFGGTVGVSNLTNQATINKFSGFETQNLGGNNVTGGGLLGYDYSFTDMLKLGIEGYVFGNGNQNANSYHNYNGTSYASQETYNWGIRVLPGIEFSSSAVGHIILGYTGGKFQTVDNGAFGYLNHDFYLSGFQSGLGLTNNITKNLFVRVDGLYTMFGKEKNNGIATNLSSIAAYSASLSTLEADLTIGYKFFL